MDQVIEVARYPSSEGVHHEVHPFLHHLHLCDHMIWNRICGGWTAHVLSLWSAWGVATFWPFIVPSLSTDAFLILLLSIKPHILLAQFLF